MSALDVHPKCCRTAMIFAYYSRWEMCGCLARFILSQGTHFNVQWFNFAFFSSPSRHLKIYFGLDMLCGFLNISIEKVLPIIKCTLSELKHNLCALINVHFLQLAPPVTPAALSISTNLQLQPSSALKSPRFVRAVYFKRINALHLIGLVNLSATKLVFVTCLQTHGWSFCSLGA